MSDFKIEKGIPLAKVQGPGRPAKYPWADMAVGDSFFVAGNSVEKIQSIAAWASKRHRPKRWKTRSVEGGIRVWRVA